MHDREELRHLYGFLKPLGNDLTLHHTRFFWASIPNGERATIFADNAGGSALIDLPPGRSLPRSLPQGLRGRVQPLG